MKKMAKVFVVCVMVLAATAAFAAEVVYLDNYASFGGVVNPADGGVGFSPLTRAGVFKKGVLIYDGSVPGGVTLTKDTEYASGSYFTAYFMKYKSEYENGEENVVEIKKPEDLTEAVVRFLNDGWTYYKDARLLVRPIEAVVPLKIAAGVEVESGGKVTKDGTTLAKGTQVSLRFPTALVEELNISSEEDIVAQLGTRREITDEEYPSQENVNHQGWTDVATDVKESLWRAVEVTKVTIAARLYGSAAHEYTFARWDGERTVYVSPEDVVVAGDLVFYAKSSELVHSTNTYNHKTLSRVAAPKSTFQVWTYGEQNSAGKLVVAMSLNLAQPSLYVEDGVRTLDAEAADKEESPRAWVNQIDGLGRCTVYWDSEVETDENNNPIEQHGHNGGGSGGSGGGGGCNAGSMGFAPLALVALLSMRKRRS